MDIDSSILSANEEELLSLSTSLSSRLSAQSSFALQPTSKSAPEKPLQVLRVLLDDLLKNSIPGPHLVRLEKEFNLVTGEGGEGKIFRASSDFQRNLASIPGKSADSRLLRSAELWRNCVIKRLRSDERRGLAFQVNSAHTEIRLLSKPSLRSHPNVIRLLGWALCLDSLEDPALSIPQLPLLILERADFDLRNFLSSRNYHETTYSDLCQICLGVGRGLEALHVENLTHGDMKPANVLILDQWMSESSSRLTTCRWLPKLCDFGLAVAFKEGGDRLNGRKYHGTGGWKPPECYLDSPQVSLQLCDVFAFGLVSWCVFVGNPSSPISTRLNQDEESATIKEQFGEQIFYRKASSSIRTIYGLMETDISLTVAESTDRVVGLGAGIAKNESSLRMRREAFSEGSRDVRIEQSNRILILLRDSLKDNPQARHHRPWEYMDFDLHVSIPLIQDLVKLPTKPKSTIKQKAIKKLMSSYNSVLAGIPPKKHVILPHVSNKYRQVMRRTKHALITFMVARAPMLIQHNPLQQSYDDLFFEIELSLLDKQTQSRDRMSPKSYSFEPNDISIFDHEEGDSCHNLDRLYDHLYRAIRDAASDADIEFNKTSNLSNSAINSIRAVFDRRRSSENSHLVHSFARLRSRFKLCCWQEYCRSQDRLYSSGGHPMLVQDILEETSILAMLSTFSFDALAWLCRGQIATAVLNSPENEPERLWNWLYDNKLGPIGKTERMTLFLERGCNIGQELHSGDSLRSVFEVYLQSLQIHYLAIDVCRQFRRHAARDGATPWEKFYLTGLSPDWYDDEPMREKDLVRTALHDAVRASSYDVVEYLVRTNFNVDIKDATGRTAIDLAEELERGLDKVEMKIQHFQNNQIIALLRQTRPSFDQRPGHSLEPTSETLPLGWKATQLDRAATVYQETSIESEADPLTFIKPREGLLENHRVALGQRRVTGQGKVYYLDPLRFLHTKIKGSERAESASEATYGEDWYRKKAREAGAPLGEPLSDKRLWYRVTMTAKYVWRYLIQQVAVPIGFADFNLYAAALGLLFVLILYDGWK